MHRSLPRIRILGGVPDTHEDSLFHRRINEVEQQLLVLAGGRGDVVEERLTSLVVVEVEDLGILAPRDHGSECLE